MSLETAIRSDLRPGDIGYITYLHGLLYAKEQGWDHTFESYVASPLSEFARRRNMRERIWICERGETIVGCIALVECSYEQAQLRWLLVHPAMRGQGLGRKLMGLLLNFAREADYSSIMLWTTNDLKAAAELYRRHGFTKVEEVTHELWGKVVTEQRYELNLR